jgi:peptide deformylase
MRLVALALAGLLAGCAATPKPTAAMNPPPSQPAFDPALVVPIVAWPAEKPVPLSSEPGAAAGDGEPGAVLRQVAAPWSTADGDIAPLLARMHATLLSSGGVGIAAPQIGVAKRVFLVKHGTRRQASEPAGKPPYIVAYVNPQVIWASPERLEDYEACLSVKGVGGELPRALRLRIRYQAADDLWGPPREVQASDWDARIFAHELDHIDGHLYIDHLAALSRPLLSIDEMRRLRDLRHRERGLVAP